MLAFPTCIKGRIQSRLLSSELELSDKSQPAHFDVSSAQAARSGAPAAQHGTGMQAMEEREKKKKKGVYFFAD